MISIDIHFHIVPPPFLDALRRGDLRDAVEVNTQADRDVLIFHAPPDIVVEPDLSIRPHSTEAPLLLQAMDKRRLDAAAVSPPPELFLYWAPPETGERIARTMNDGMARLARAHPGRFLPLATVPMQDPPRAVRELERAITELGLVGAALCTHVGGLDLDDPRFETVFAAAARLDVPLFLHPQNAGDVSRLAAFHLWNVIGFPLETTITASRLIAGGLFERHPRLNIVLAHAGGYFPYQLGRLDHAWRMKPEAFPALPQAPSAYLENIYFDSLTHDAGALRFLLDRVGTGHVVLGTDYPFTMQCNNPIEAIEALSLPPAPQAAVLGGTLSRLLKF